MHSCVSFFSRNNARMSKHYFPMKTAFRLIVGLVALAYVAQAAEQPNVGYSDTPKLPDQPWLVHDGKRPQPPKVTAGKSFSEGAPAPSDAIVLFNGKDLSKWTGQGDKAQWKLQDNYMEVNGTGSIRTREEFADFQLHVEWATPEEVKGSSQGRGNSGVIIHGLYEVQVLDSYNNPTYPDGQAGSMYGQFPPLVNASRGPGQWQTYDIIFETDRWDGDKLVKPASVTVIHNGVVLHHKQEYIGVSLHRQVGRYKPRQDPKGPIVLQDHSNPVRYRNIWIRPLGQYDQK